MRIGILRNKVIFLSHGGAADGQGGYNDDATSLDEWTKVCEVWGECVPLSGRELYYAQQMVPTVSHRLTIRYRGDIKTTMRAQIGDMLLDIQVVLDVEMRHKVLHVFCEQVFPS